MTLPIEIPCPKKKVNLIMTTWSLSFVVGSPIGGKWNFGRYYEELLRGREHSKQSDGDGVAAVAIKPRTPAPPVAAHAGDADGEDVGVGSLIFVLEE